MRKPDEKTAAEMRAALSGIRCFLLDMDGTFYLGDRIIEGSMEFLQKVEQTGRSYLFLTNNSSRSVQHYVEKLGRLEVDDFEIEPCSCIRSVCCSAAEREKQKHHQQAHAADYHPEAKNYFIVDK